MKWILFPLAWISLILGIIGVFLPVIPTTPFLILSAFLFSKSSPFFHQWLMKNPWAGGPIMDWQQNKVIRPKAKVLCGGMIIFSLTLIWLNDHLPIFFKAFVTGLLTIVGLFVLSRKSFLK